MSFQPAISNAQGRDDKERTHEASTQHMSTAVEEFRAAPETAAQVRGTQNLGDKPLAVVSAGEQPSKCRTSWPRSQRRDARVSSAAIYRVVEAARNNRPLSRQKGAPR
jgi:hypothetical protein